MSKIKMRLRDKDPIKMTVKNAVQKIYPQLENLYVVPSGELQTFKSKDYYGYDTVTVNPILLQNKEVTPTKEQQVVKADAEFSGLNEVIVNVPSMQNKTVIPTKERQTIIADNDYIGLDNVTVEAVTNEIDSNIKAENIKVGINILGVDGTLEPDKPNQSKEVTPTKESQIIKADDGYELEQVTVNGDNNLVADNIKKGISIFGVNGTMEKGDISTLIDPFNLDEIVNAHLKEGNIQSCGVLFNLDTYGENELKFTYDYTTCFQYILFPDGTELTSEELGTNYVYNVDESLVKTNGIGNRMTWVIVYFRNDSSPYLGNTDNTNIFTSRRVDKLSLRNIFDTTLNCAYLKEASGTNCSVYRQTTYYMTSYKNMDFTSNTGKFYFWDAYGLIEMKNINFQNAVFAFSSSSYKGSTARNLQIIENVSNINMEFYLSNSEKLTKQSIVNLLNGLVDLTGQTSKTLTIGTTNLAKISDEIKAIAINKNWNLS